MTQNSPLMRFASDGWWGALIPEANSLGFSESLRGILRGIGASQRHRVTVSLVEPANERLEERCGRPP
jgi:hypothetical protein